MLRSGKKEADVHKTFIIALALLAVPLAAHPQQDLRAPKQGGVYVMAHRGAHEGIPENTLPAYARAIELGADFVEIDVRTTKDVRFVSIHNASIDGYVPGAAGKVKEMTFEELRKLDVGARVGPEWAGTTIPTFEEILDLCKGKIGIYLDLKDAPVAPLVEEIRKRGMERDVLWYAGPSKLRELGQLCPECIPMPDPGPEKNLAKLLQDFKPRIVASVWKQYSKTFAEACHAANAIVIVDEDGTECWQQMLEWKTDGIQTDHPEALIKLLRERAK